MPENFVSLRYPENLGTSSSPNYVTFSPVEIDYGTGTNYGNPVDRGSGGLFGGGSGGGLDINLGGGNPFKQIANQIGGTLTSLADAALDSIDAIGSIFEAGSLSAKASAFGKIVNGKIRIGDFILSSGIKTTAPQLNTKGSISLYLPQSLTSNTSANYENKELGATGAAALEATSGTDTLNASEDAPKLLEALLGDTIKRTGQLGDILAIKEGAIVNPYSYQLFGGVSHRTFSYQFDFVPKNAKEAREVANICDMFLFYMLPSKGIGDAETKFFSQNELKDGEAATKDNMGSEIKGDFGRHFLKMPSMWEINYFRNGNELSHVQKPNKCFMDTCNITYGGDSGNLLHSDGSPVKTTIEMSFTEVEPLVRGRQ